METDRNQATASDTDDDNTKGWTRLYLLVVGALAAQVAFFAWITRAFA